MHHTLHQNLEKVLGLLKTKVEGVLHHADDLLLHLRTQGPGRERNGCDLTQSREGTSQKHQHKYNITVCPRDGGVYGHLCQETNEWEEA